MCYANKSIYVKMKACRRASLPKRIDRKTRQVSTSASDEVP